LRRAVELTRPGGVIVYSTCTYAPEENEAVLDGIYAEKAAIEPIAMPAEVTVDPGITEWQGEQYRGDVANAIRLDLPGGALWHGPLDLRRPLLVAAGRAQGRLAPSPQRRAARRP
ncbi:MAG: hypothetical protein ABEJ96_07535, partial [Thiohalorhabdaceae bacterium]